MSLSEHSTTDTHRPFTGDGYHSMEGNTQGVGALPVNSYPKSPYSDAEIVCLDVGPNKDSFRIHRMILSQSPVLEAKPAGTLWGDRTVASISLAEIDVPTAHTLVHYLYSGKYQTLESSEDTFDPFQKENANALSVYKGGTCVYCAAMRYKLPSLAELAKERITSISKRLSIIDVLSVAREHAFPILPVDETWYATFLDEAIRSALAEDPELYLQPQFLEQIGGNVRFKKVVMRAMMNSHARAPPSVSDRPTGLSTPMTDTRDDERMEKVASFRNALESDAQSEADPSTSSGAERTVEPATDSATGTKLESVTEEIGTEEPKSSAASGDFEDEKTSPVRISCPIKPSVKVSTEEYFDEIEPSSASRKEPEPFTDELGYTNSKTYKNQRQGKKAEIEPMLLADMIPEGVSTPLEIGSVLSTTEKPELGNSTHKRADSAIQITEPESEPTPVSEEKGVGSPEVQADASPATVEQVYSPFSRKKKKKKGGRTTWN